MRCTVGTEADTAAQRRTLLGPHELPVYEVANSAGSAPILFTCDHASNRVPESLRQLGLRRADLARHIGWDPGAAELTLRLARHFDAPAILTRYSRLVIDCNRHPDSSDSIPTVSDGTTVPGNLELKPSAGRMRLEELFHPYHQAISTILAGMRASGAVPTYVAIHTFTPRMNGFSRPWHVGVLWDRDSQLAEPLMDVLRSIPGMVVGDNKPYSARGRFDYSRMHHASAGGLPYALIEVREDLLADEAGMSRYAAILCKALEEALPRAG